EPRRSWQARCRSSDARPKLMPRTADFRVLAGLDLDVLGCPDFGAALAHERKLVAARHALVAVRGGLIAVEVRCRETADQNDGVEHDRFISRVGQPTGQRHWFVVSSCSKVRGLKNGMAKRKKTGGLEQLSWVAAGTPVAHCGGRLAISHGSHYIPASSH